MAETNIEWLDLSAHNAKLSVLRFPDGRTRIVLTGLKDGSADWLWAEKNGYQASPNRLSLFTGETKISFSKFLAHFKKGKKTLIPRNELVRVVSQGNMQSIKTDVELRTVKRLGLNYLGQDVFEGATGRFVRSNPDHDSGQQINEGDASSAAFLRVKTPDDLALCADGLVETMARGEILRAQELRRFAGVVYGLTGDMDTGDLRLRDVQEAVEASMQRRLEKEAFIADRGAFDWAVSLTEKQPPFIFRTSTSIENQQYSTVLPLAVAVQHMLGDTAGKTVLEPTIGNGSLVSLLPSGTEITGYEIDPKRVDQVERLRDGMAVFQGDFTQVDTAGMPTKFDLIVANPPFGGLTPNVEIAGMRITRLDHLILMKSLEARQDNGRAVFIIGADRENLIDKNAGKVSGGSKNLFNWLADHYDLEGVAEVDGRLYAKQGAGYPVRIVVVGAARSPEAAAKARETKEFRLGESVPVLRSWDEVWSFAEEHTPKLILETPVEIQEEVIQENEEVNREENYYQAPYVPSSKIGEASSMIPRNMLSSASKALDALEEGFGSIDEFVGNKLQMTMGDLAQAFSPEQIDAIGLAIARVDEGRGFIVGDQTGLGKGRQVAAMARYAALSKHSIIFMTEKPNLFSDLWRDIKDICVDMDPKTIFKPFILNDGVGIRDENNQIVFPATRKETVKKMIDDNTHPFDEGYTITFATYSQFGRELAKSPKSGWLGNAARDSLMILDESHNAAGESNAAVNVASAVEKSWGCVYSSATFAKNAKNMAAYSKVFPATISAESLPDILAIGGEALQEILAANLAEDGSMIRREHDLSNLTFQTMRDTEHFERNKAMSDQLSEILLAMSHMSGDVANMCKQLNKDLAKQIKKLGAEQTKGARIGASSMNFGSRLYNVLRQFQMAIKVDEAVRIGIGALNAGQKPVYVTEQTMESLLAETLLDHDPEDAETGDEVKIDSPVELAKLTFRDVLYRLLDKIDSIVERDDYGSVTRTTAIRKAKNEDEMKAWERSKQAIMDMIDEFPDLPVSPLDTIREKIEEAGFSCSEISGRKMQVNTALDGGIKVTARPDDRLKTIHAFNNGLLDAVILTRAGSTGISLHASEKFEDQRQRVMIELQIPNNVAERMQFFGRVNRKGQTSSPIICTISSEMPSEVRILAMQDAKIRRLSANTQSNRENAAESKNKTDILNPLGNEIAYRFLENNPSIASDLDVQLGEDGMSDHQADGLYFVNRLTSRIALLRFDTQVETLDLLAEEFNVMLTELEKKGENPFKTAEHNWGARVVSRELFDGAVCPRASVFEQPVYLSALEWDEEIEPMKWAHVESRILSDCLPGLLSDGRIQAIEGKTINGFPKLEMDKVVEDVKGAFERIIEETLPSLLDEDKGVKTLADVLKLEKPNAIKSAVSRRDFLCKAIQDLRPGRMLGFNGDTGEDQEGVIVEFRLPDSDKYLHLLGKYEVKIAVPGERAPQNHTVYSLQKMGYSKDVYFGDDYSNFQEKIAKRFDEAPSGKLTRSRLVLDGNLFRAAQIAAQIGGRSGIYIDEHGTRQRAIIMGSLMTAMDMKKAPPRVPTPAMAVELLKLHDRVELVDTALKLDGSTTIRALNSYRSEFNLVVPGSKSSGDKYFLDPALLAITGDFAGNRSQMTVHISAEKLDRVMVELYRISGGLYAPNSLREVVNELQAQQQERLFGKNEVVVNKSVVGMAA